MDLRDLYTSPSVLVFKSGRMCRTGHVGKSEGPRRLRRPRHRWEDDIKMGLKEISWRELSRLIQVRTGQVGCSEVVINVRFIENAENSLTNRVNINRSQQPRGLRRRSTAARLLRWWVRIPLGAWMFVCCECCVLSGRGLCDGLIIRSEESYRLWRVVVCDQVTSYARRLKPDRGL